VLLHERRWCQRHLRKRRFRKRKVRALKKYRERRCWDSGRCFCDRYPLYHQPWSFEKGRRSRKRECWFLSDRLWIADG